jgi:hypothetical protein
MYFNFRPLFRVIFAELSQKYPYSQTLVISRGALKEKRAPTALAFNSRKALLWKFSHCIWNYF